MGRSDNLWMAKKTKDDEFYTLYDDVKGEMELFKEDLKGKIIYCNCDTEESNFVKFFNDVKEDWGIKEIIYSGRENGGFEWHFKELEYCDIVITNPPFSKVGDFLDLMERFKKKYIFIGNMNCIAINSFISLIKKGRLFVNTNTITGSNLMHFIRPNDSIKNITAIWYNNIKRVKQRDLNLTKSISDIEMIKYDDYDAIEINRISNIPYDYYGLMGVPITFAYYNYQDEFEVVNILHNQKGVPKLYVDGKMKFGRILIKRKSDGQ